MNSKYQSELVTILLAVKNKKEMADFLYGILTPQELEEIPVRLQIIKLLKKGVPQHEIAKKLGNVPKTKYQKPIYQFLKIGLYMPLELLKEKSYFFKLSKY